MQQTLVHSLTSDRRLECLSCFTQADIMTTYAGLNVAPQVVSPTISSPVCQEQLVEAGKLVDRSVETCVKACRSASADGELLKQVGAAAGMVSQALGDLLQHVRHYASCGEPIGRYDQATDTIMNVTENIVTSMGDAGESGRVEKGSGSSFGSSFSASCLPTVRGVKNQSGMKNICHQACSYVRKAPQDVSPELAIRGTSPPPLPARHFSKVPAICYGLRHEAQHLSKAQVQFSRGL